MSSGRSRRALGASGFAALLLAGAAGIALAQRAPWPPQGANVPIAADPTARNYYVVLDGSGSMGEGACRGPGTKIDQARGALTEFAAALPRNSQLGLMVFDRGGTREVVALSAGDREPFLRAVRAASPGGLTPLKSAITLARQRIEDQARRQLGYGEYHLVVVTDGEASAGEDPRASVNAMLAGTPIVLHTIGFCIDARHSLNQPGRTIYRAASDPAELRRGLQSVLAEAPNFTAQRFGAAAAPKSAAK